MLHPERELKFVLDNLKSELGSENFAAQYQQRPIPPSGATIKREWVRRYDRLPIRSASSYVFQSWDTAIKAEAEHSFSVCTTWLVHEGGYYLVDELRGRFNFPTLKDRAIAHAQKHKPNKILIEDAALGQALVDELKGAGLPAIAVRPEGDKRTRMSIQSIKFENRLVFLPKEAPWLAQLEDELFTFPHSAHDDQVDSRGAGNIGELQNFIERPDILWEGDRLRCRKPTPRYDGRSPVEWRILVSRRLSRKDREWRTSSAASSMHFRDWYGLRGLMGTSTS